MGVCATGAPERRVAGCTRRERRGVRDNKAGIRRCQTHRRCARRGGELRSRYKLPAMHRWVAVVGCLLAGCGQTPANDWERVRSVEGCTAIDRLDEPREFHV